jgi:hemoglobin
VTLFERYGGYDTFARVVEAFYRSVLREPTLQPYFEGVHMPRLMDHQTKFLAMALGGPARYEGASLKAAHARLKIADRDFDLVAELLVEALEDAGMAKEDVDQVVEIVLGTRSQIVGETA